MIVRDRTGAPLINVNLELSRRMLKLTERQRTLRLPRLMREIIGSAEKGSVLLDNIEVLSGHLGGVVQRFEEYLDEFTKGKKPGKVRIVLE